LAWPSGIFKSNPRTAQSLPQILAQGWHSSNRHRRLAEAVPPANPHEYRV
jgi:hypothetical protein